MMHVFVESVGVIGPGLNGWRASQPILAGAAPYLATEVVLPAPELLPPAERRRTGLPVRLALCAGLDALSASQRSPEALASVFTSSGGDGQVLHSLCETLTTAERQISPTRFHNSVHNAPAGYWSIATRAQAPSTSICGYEWSFAAGLLEAAAQCVCEGAPVLLISYDLPYPEPLHAVRPITGTLGIALLLAAESSVSGCVRLQLDVEQRSTPPTLVREPSLRAVQKGNPTGRALPLLEALAQPSADTTVTLEYVAGNSVTAKVLAPR